MSLFQFTTLIYRCNGLAELAGGFSTDQPIPHETKNYGYESDSDLDDSEDEDEGDEEPVGHCSLASTPTMPVEPGVRFFSCSLSCSSYAKLEPFTVRQPLARSAACRKAKHLVGLEYKYRIVVPDVASRR